MKLKFFSTFFEFIQSQSLNIEIKEVLAFLGNSQKETSKFIDVVNFLASKKPGFKDMIIDGGEIKAYINILLNGQNIKHLEGLKTLLSENDQIAFFPPIGGG